MADYLLVVDMQSDYVAVGKAYHEELTAAVNDKIATYPSDRVIYILNRFFWERKDRKKKFATGLLLVSSRIFEKRRASCFTNPDLKDFCKVPELAFFLSPIKGPSLSQIPYKNAPLIHDNLALHDG